MDPNGYKFQAFKKSMKSIFILTTKITKWTKVWLSFVNYPIHRQSFSKSTPKKDQELTR